MLTLLTIGSQGRLFTGAGRGKPDGALPWTDCGKAITLSVTRDMACEDLLLVTIMAVNAHVMFNV